jgi:DNA-binding response OmpR family regulator
MKNHEILLLHEDPWLLNAIAFGLEPIGCQLDMVFDKAGAIECMDIEAEGHRYHFTKMSDTRTASHTLSMKHFDLVIADANTPDASNLAVLKKARESRARTAVMICEANQDFAPDIDLLADDYLLTPFSPKEFWNKMLNCLEECALS